VEVGEVVDTSTDVVGSGVGVGLSEELSRVVGSGVEVRLAEELTSRVELDMVRTDVSLGMTEELIVLDITTSEGTGATMELERRVSVWLVLLELDRVDEEDWEDAAHFP
jgi:hypothetical protein